MRTENAEGIGIARDEERVQASAKRVRGRRLCSGRTWVRHESILTEEPGRTKGVRKGNVVEEGYQIPLWPCERSRMRSSFFERSSHKKGFKIKLAFGCNSADESLAAAADMKSIFISGRTARNWRANSMPSMGACEYL